MKSSLTRRSIVLAPLLCLSALGLSCVRGPVATAPAPEVVRTGGGAEMVLVPGGTFLMGSASRPEEGPVRRVTVGPFLMDRREVTQALYQGLDLPNPSHFKGPDLPVEQITWAQAARFCNERSRAEKLRPCYDEETAACDFDADGYRLPTEAEWEYACRAGTTGDHPGGDAQSLGRLAWFAGNAGKKTHPTGTRKPNAWGLFDMMGNVAEWCNDVYAPGHGSPDPVVDPRGPSDGEQYVLRGGSWASSADGLRASGRVGENPGFSDACLARDAIGFRCVRKAPAGPPPIARVAPGSRAD